MNLAERRRALMMQHSDGNLFNINNVRICYRDSYGKNFVPKIENNIVWNGGKSGHSSGGLIYVPLKSADKVNFSANLQFTRNDLNATKTILEIRGFNSIRDDDIIIGDAPVLYQNTKIPTTQNNISRIINTSGYVYLGFCFWTEEQYVMGLSDIKISKEA